MTFNEVRVLHGIENLLDFITIFTCYEYNKEKVLDKLLDYHKGCEPGDLDFKLLNAVYKVIVEHKET